MARDFQLFSVANLLGLRFPLFTVTSERSAATLRLMGGGGWIRLASGVWKRGPEVPKPEGNLCPAAVVTPAEGGLWAGDPVDPGVEESEVRTGREEPVYLGRGGRRIGYRLQLLSDWRLGCIRFHGRDSLFMKSG